MKTQPTEFCCLSLWQPWASLIACGAKYLETRTWDTKIRGPLLIHASATRDGLAELRNAPISTIEMMEAALGLKMGRWATDLPFGAFVAATQLEHTEPAPSALLAYPDQAPVGNFGHGRFAHHYGQTHKIEPIPAKGSQRFFRRTEAPTLLTDHGSPGSTVFWVHKPNTKLTPIRIPLVWDATISQWVLTEQAHQIIDSTKKTHAT